MDYAPMSHTIAEHILSFNEIKYDKTFPLLPFQQLLCVLPPKSANLIPEPLCRLLTDEHSPLKEQCPEHFQIDLSGKRKEWEGIVILPMVDFNLVRDHYLKMLDKVDKNDLKRNTSGRSFVYEYVPDLPGSFRSYYGDIEKCRVRTKMIDL
jgi:5'-3' exonuclease